MKWNKQKEQKQAGMLYFLKLLFRFRIPGNVKRGF